MLYQPYLPLSHSNLPVFNPTLYLLYSYSTQPYAGYTHSDIQENCKAVAPPFEGYFTLFILSVILLYDTSCV